MDQDIYPLIRIDQVPSTSSEDLRRCERDLRNLILKEEEEDSAHTASSPSSALVNYATKLIHVIGTHLLKVQSQLKQQQRSSYVRVPLPSSLSSAHDHDNANDHDTSASPVTSISTYKLSSSSSSSRHEIPPGSSNNRRLRRNCLRTRAKKAVLSLKRKSYDFQNAQNMKRRIQNTNERRMKAQKRIQEMELKRKQSIKRKKKIKEGKHVKQEHILCEDMKKW